MPVLPLISLIVFSLFFLVTFYVLIRRDLLIGAFYGMLYIYTIFMQVGYAFFPELSISLNSYFGEMYFYQNHYFIFLSFAIYFILCYLYLLSNNNCAKYLYQISYTRSEGIFGIYVLSYLIYLLITASLFVLLYDELSYQSMPSGSYMLFGVMYKLLTIFTFVHYAAYRNTRPGARRFFIKFFLVISFALCLLISIKIGSRTDLVALILGVSIFETYLSIVNKNVYKTIKRLIF